MSFKTGHTPSSKGKTTTSEPIRDPQKVAEIKELLKDSERDLALWTLALNTALRAGDLVNLTWDDINDDGHSITLTVLEGKTKKRRVIPLNPASSFVLRAWRANCESGYIFSGQRGQMSTEGWSRLVKSWCKSVGLEGNFSSHTTRKTFVRLQHDVHGTSLTTLMHMLNHSTPQQTKIYMGKMDDDVLTAYEYEI
jgi:integrase